MSYSFSLTQKVNFYISIAFIFLFGLFLTTTVVQAISRDASDIKFLTPSYEMSQQ